MQNIGVFVAIGCVVVAAGVWFLAGRNKSKAPKTAATPTPATSTSSTATPPASTAPPTPTPKTPTPSSASSAPSPAPKPLNLNTNEALEAHKEEFRRQKAARGDNAAPITPVYTEAPVEEEAESGLAALDKAEASLVALNTKMQELTPENKQLLSACKQQAHQISNSLDEIAVGDIEDDLQREAAKARKKAVAVGVKAALATLDLM